MKDKLCLHSGWASGSTVIFPTISCYHHTDRCTVCSLFLQKKVSQLVRTPTGHRQALIFYVNFFKHLSGFICPQSSFTLFFFLLFARTNLKVFCCSQNTFNLVEFIFYFFQLISVDILITSDHTASCVQPSPSCHSDALPRYSGLTLHCLKSPTLACVCVLDTEGPGSLHADTGIPLISHSLKAHIRWRGIDFRHSNQPVLLILSADSIPGHHFTNVPVQAVLTFPRAPTVLPALLFPMSPESAQICNDTTIFPQNC